MADSVYNSYKAHALSGTFRLDDGATYVMLVSGSYNGASVTNKRTHTVTGSIPAGSEVVDPLGSYVKGGKALTNPSVVVDNTNDLGVFQADNISWASSTITASGAVVYHSGGTPATSYLVAFVDFGANQSSSNGTFQINWNNGRLFTLDDV